MIKEQGNLTVSSENIFPIIKKWLYEDHDIFIRELVSNANDAITKCKKLELMGELELPEDNKYKIEVIADADKKTITFVDNGIGMTADEVKKYINDIAFSGATDFVEKYKDKATDDEIIGHFGLGFYSAFMVADKVTIDTLSWQEGAEPVYWESEGGLSYSMSIGSKDTRGTKITLHLSEDSYEFCNEYRVREVLNKYCAFMPVEIYFTNPNAEPIYEEVEIDEDEDSKVLSADNDDVIEAEVDEDGKAVEKPKKTKKVLKKPEPINETNPIWRKNPSECSDGDYIDFYRSVFHDYREPLFWIHLNMDYPYNLKGILYFPKINTQYEAVEGTIKLYSDQVFVADNIKEVIPEFLLLLKGVIDCPDFPLNVSRSALQNDGTVKKISDYITKKVADKLSGMYKTDRDNYNKFWDDISPFIKYGCLSDSKFADRMKDYIIFKNLDNEYISLADYGKDVDAKEDGENKSEETKASDSKEEKEEKKTIVYYVTDEKQQSQYINMFKEIGKDAILLTDAIDQPFITHLEQREDTYSFKRIDADISDEFQEGNQDSLKEENEKLSELFKKELANDKLNIKVMNLKNDKIASIMTLSEESRRMQEMMRMYSASGMDSDLFKGEETLILNAKNNLVKHLLNNSEGEYTKLICEQLYDLALLSHKQLDSESMTKFIRRSSEILEIITK
ncbi:MAG: molecular chaperone HtpG [Clostridiales bacterium]|nr:molecular chaperone HtpG [Clostridiales bacterium]